MVSATKKATHHDRHLSPDLEKGGSQEEYRRKLHELECKHTAKYKQHDIAFRELERSRDVLRRNFERANEDYVRLCVEYDENGYRDLAQRRAEPDDENPHCPYGADGWGWCDGCGLCAGSSSESFHVSA